VHEAEDSHGWPDRQPDVELPPDLVAALDQHGIAVRDEVGLRRELERQLPGYTLYRLMPAAAKRWKCRYRIMFAKAYFDCQTVPEAYARALLATLDGEATSN
jgi:hypothetical protein